MANSKQKTRNLKQKTEKKSISREKCKKSSKHTATRCQKTLKLPNQVNNKEHMNEEFDIKPKTLSR